MPHVDFTALADPAVNIFLQNIDEYHRAWLFFSPNPSSAVGKPNGLLTVVYTVLN